MKLSVIAMTIASPSVTWRCVFTQDCTVGIRSVFYVYRMIEFRSIGYSYG